MANVRIAVSKKGTLIAMIALVVLLGGGGGYLLWRVNQKDTVAPTDSSAGSCRPCPGCSTCMDHEVLIGDECCVRGGTQPPAGRCRCCVGCSTCMDDEVMVNGNQCCTSGGTPLSNCGNTPPGGGGGGGGGGGTPACSANPVTYFLRDGTEKSCSACPAENKPEGQRCIGKSPYDYECGTHCFDPSCGKEACDNISNPAPTVTLTYKASAGGSILGEANQTFRKGGDGTQVEAKANPNFKFEKWSNDNNRSATRRDTNVMESVTYTATFRALQVEAFTLTYTAGTGGSISGTTPQTVNKGASGTQVTAVPSAGYVFDKWSDGKTTASRTDSNVQANATYTASFKTAPVDTFTLTYIAGEGGSINGSSSQTVTKGGNGSPVTAVANDGYVFDGWSDDPAKGATRTDSNIQANAAYTASFKTNVACGDGMCTGGEDSSNCPVDCGSPVVGSTVPQTGLFDETKNIVIMGVVLLMLGIAWTWVSTLPKKAYTSIKTVSKASSEYISNVKVQKERNIRESRRNRLEKRIE